MNTETLLEVQNLKTSFFTERGEVEAVRGVDFSIGKGEIVAVVGESGCGKSVMVKSIMCIIKKPGKVKQGRILFHGEDILRFDKEKVRNMKGNDIAMIFQDPMTSLNPLFTVGAQLVETILAHRRISRAEAKMTALEFLARVKIAAPAERFGNYPHELSGGMRQRVVIAMALLNNPDLLIADEPTTALDVTIQDQILRLIKQIKNELNKSVILITHDLGVVAESCAKVLVMYAGLIVEQGSREDIFYHTAHPYTRGLLDSMPDMEAEGSKLRQINGTPPPLINPPKGCAFADRCPQAMLLCKQSPPPLVGVSVGHSSRCWLLDPEVKNRLE